jgi:hypothetical protein
MYDHRRHLKQKRCNVLDCVIGIYDDVPMATMIQFLFTIGPFSGTTTSSKVLTVIVDTEDTIYTLGPRVCRPVYVENTAWLCSQQAGCVSSTATNAP